MGKPGFLGGAGFFWGRLRAEGDFANRGRGSANRKLIFANRNAFFANRISICK
jgi:hypothetical protein